MQARAQSPSTPGSPYAIEMNDRDDPFVGDILQDSEKGRMYKSSGATIRKAMPLVIIIQ